MASPSKGCGSDPIPTPLLREILPSVIDFITAILNQPLQEVDMPDNTKESLIKPLLKKANLRRKILWNQTSRHVANISALKHQRSKCMHILKAMDKQEVTFLILLDLSAAFDTLIMKFFFKGLKTELALKERSINGLSHT